VSQPESVQVASAVVFLGTHQVCLRLTNVQQLSEKFWDLMLMMMAMLMPRGCQRNWKVKPAAQMKTSTDLCRWIYKFLLGN